MKFFRRRDFVILVLLVFAPTFFFLSARTMNTITGAVIYAEDILPEVEQLALNHPLTRLAGDGAKLCVLINDGTDYASFNIDKAGPDEFNVSEADYKYCDTAENEDFILEFLSYSSFKKEVNDNSCNSFKKGWGGTDYYFLVSKFVEKGGHFVCSDKFTELYCGAISFCYTDEEIDAYKLDCCKDYFPSGEKLDLYDELLDEGIKKGTTVDRPKMREKEAEQQPENSDTTSPYYAEPSSILGSVLIWVILPIMIVVLAGGIFAALKFMPQKPRINPQIQQLQDYVYSTLSAGYPGDQLYYYLLQQGWSKSILDDVFQKIYKRQ